ncbi:hypothetical protein IPF37_02835 [bacterium]|nr:MAG: hypothetical protein IPF37_02835 [bacterium]
MKKIIFLSIGLLFSSVHAHVLSEAEITQAAVVLEHHPELVARVHTLCAWGLTHEQMVAQLMQTSEARAYLLLGDPDYEKDKNKRAQELTPIEIILSLGVPLCVLIIGLYFELQSQEK